jgi:hypothetical protein
MAAAPTTMAPAKCLGLLGVQHTAYNRRGHERPENVSQHIDWLPWNIG